jgi:hypothetical protein
VVFLSIATNSTQQASKLASKSTRFTDGNVRQTGGNNERHNEEHNGDDENKQTYTKDKGNVIGQTQILKWIRKA